eukprot:TRINITY_DN17292_c0_g1_i3.p2 TRINITY_DN17292_c0_g1~~TRINITY_DN17292_c0_g1_i3.p2  ORF type:complete len:112 (+),score=6.75 TRINITY_DN17292_c0_g1_i3:111-446(+)
MALDLGDPKVMRRVTRMPHTAYPPPYTIPHFEQVPHPTYYTTIPPFGYYPVQFHTYPQQPPPPPLPPPATIPPPTTGHPPGTGPRRPHRHKQIGRAVQQECRDRSRMPSSA